MDDFDKVTVTSVMRKTADGTTVIHLNDDEFKCIKFLIEDAAEFHRNLFNDIPDDDFLKEIDAYEGKVMLTSNNHLFEKLKTIGINVEKFE